MHRPDVGRGVDLRHVVSLARTLAASRGAAPRRPEPRCDDGPVSTAALVIASVSSAFTAIVVVALFVWAARRDGEYDEATQKRLGIRRRTRL